MRHSKIGMSLSALGQSRPIDGGSVSALPPFATKFGAAPKRRFRPKTTFCAAVMSEFQRAIFARE